MRKDESCERCSGTGWVIDERGIARRCGCQQTDIYLSKAEKANIPKRFLGYELKTFFPHRDHAAMHERVIKKAAKFVEDYPAVAEKGILFHGIAGVGKTRLLCSIATELMKKVEDLDIFYIDWNDLVRSMRGGEHHITKDFTDINRFIERLAAVDLLLFDELGASTINELSQWIMDSIYYIFNKRYNDQKITLCATNFFDNPKDRSESLSLRIGDRIRSRLFEMTESVVIEGKDRRKEM